MLDEQLRRIDDFIKGSKMLNQSQKNLILKLLKKEKEKITDSSLDAEIIKAHTNLIITTTKAIAEGASSKPDITKLLDVDELVDFDELVFSSGGKPIRRYRQKP